MTRPQFKIAVLPGIVLLVGLAALQFQRQTAPEYGEWIPALFLAIGFPIGEGLRRRYFPSTDAYLLPLSFLLSAIGLVMICRLKPTLFAAQSEWLALGICFCFAAACVARNIEQLMRYKYSIGLLGIFMLLAALFFGTEIGGSRSWILLGPVRFQPSEFSKLLIIVFLAAYLVEYRNLLTIEDRKIGPISLPPLRFVAPLIVVWGIAMLMFVLQRDLGSALLFFGIAVTMMYMASGKWEYVVLSGAFFFSSSTLCYALFAHVRARVAIWYDPWADPNGQAYQVIQSLFAFGRGGVLGTGLGSGVPTAIPEVHTDFIFSAVAEELGFIGAMAVLILYLLLAYRGFKIALHCKEAVAMLLAAGLSFAIAFQVFIILAGVTKLLPLTGITLPFMSYGGSSMLANFIAVGCLLALSEKRRNDV